MSVKFNCSVSKEDTPQRIRSSASIQLHKMWLVAEAIIQAFQIRIYVIWLFMAVIYFKIRWDNAVSKATGC
jgi:hypothetical protein